VCLAVIVLMVAGVVAVAVRVASHHHGARTTSPAEKIIDGHLRQIAGSSEFHQVPSGATMIKSASTKCGDTEHDPAVWREYRVASATAASAELTQAWQRAGWRADHRSTLTGDSTVAKSFAGWTAGLSAYIVDATHVEVSGEDLDDNC
jgi:hypothetical protein